MRLFSSYYVASAIPTDHCRWRSLVTAGSTLPDLLLDFQQSQIHMWYDMDVITSPPSSSFPRLTSRPLLPHTHLQTLYYLDLIFLFISHFPLSRHEAMRHNVPYPGNLTMYHADISDVVSIKTPVSVLLVPNLVLEYDSSALPSDSPLIQKIPKSNFIQFMITQNLCSWLWLGKTVAWINSRVTLWIPWTMNKYMGSY